MKKEKLYIVKSSTFKGVWKYWDGSTKDVIAERYLGIGDTQIIQMNGMNYDRKKLLVFKSREAAEKACMCANSALQKLAVYSPHYGEVIPLKDYKVKEYTSKRPINSMTPIPLFGGTAYTIK